MTLTRKLKFIVCFGPALVFYPVGAFVTACRLAYASGRALAVRLLAESIAESIAEKEIK